jgi:DNA-binding NarL/FixJ family response regulator
VSSGGATARIRVAIVDDQTLVRRGIAELLALAPDIEVVAEAADGEEALRLIRERTPNIILLDVRMPEMTGLEVLRELKAKSLPGAAIMLTTFDDDTALIESMKHGARGFLLKDTSLDELLAAIRTVAAGGAIPRPAITTRVLRGIADIRSSAASPSASSRAAHATPLTERETEILRLMAGGFSNREIAGALSVAEGTIKNHVSNILTKLDVRDRTRAVLRGLEQGLV